MLIDLIRRGREIEGEGEGLKLKTGKGAADITPLVIKYRKIVCKTRVEGGLRRSLK